MRMDLVELVGHLREQLADAVEAGAGADLRFEVGAVEVEVSVVVEREAKAGGKAKFWVVEAGTDAKLAHHHTQRIKLSLTPTRGQESVAIAGVEAGAER
ncbi:trypco2 family protein [Actinokineospora inagensis]|uniref:trypco2 family protein n=1 Tax=Actinokineospora inagensis TaxID=103730 RepID=UPI00042378DE|nr:trypco2 family protein [Actinokineospora inagensis]